MKTKDAPTLMTGLLGETHQSDGPIVCWPDFPSIMSNQSHSILTADEIADELRCSKTHVYNLMNGRVAGVTVLPHLALGRKKVVPRLAFEKWKEKNLTGNIQDDSDTNGVYAWKGQHA